MIKETDNSLIIMFFIFLCIKLLFLDYKFFVLRYINYFFVSFYFHKFQY